MSRSHEGCWPYFPSSNIFKLIFPKCLSPSPKLFSLLKSFEESLAEKFKNLKPKKGIEVLSLLWMKDAMQALSEMHTNIKSLITDLQFPVFNWDDKWMDLYLDCSVKLLDICIAFRSKLSQIGQGQLFLQLVLHIMDKPNDVFFHKNIKQVENSLCDWMQQMNCSSPRLENSSAILLDLVASLHTTKFTDSSKGKILMQAMYGVRILTVFVCAVLSTTLSGSPNLLMDFPVPENFLWTDAFNELHFTVNSEIRRKLPFGRRVVLKELEAVDHYVGGLLCLTSNVFQKSRDFCDGQCDGQEQNDIEKEKIEASNNCILNLSERRNKTIGDGKCERQESSGIEKDEAEALRNSVSCLAESSEKLSCGLEQVSEQVENLFQILLSGRDALLCSLQTLDIMEEDDTMEESRPYVGIC